MTKVMSRFCASWTDTNAHAQEAFGGVSAMFAAVGMTKTADTGQMVLGSVVAQLSGGFPYYEMWTWTDTTGTIVMKWEYGVSSSVPVTQRVKFRVT